MEDVWAELTLSSLVHRSNAETAVPSPPFPGLRLQTLLGCHVYKNDGDPSKPRTKTLSSEITIQNPDSQPSGKIHALDEQSNLRKRIRLMKNRESAVRSRARKQAYTYELELEVARLVKDNAKMQKHLKEQRKSEVAEGEKVEHEKQKYQLTRTASAPF